jgi:hypothetical protein
MYEYLSMIHDGFFESQQMYRSGSVLKNCILVYTNIPDSHLIIDFLEDELPRKENPLSLQTLKNRTRSTF